MESEAVLDMVQGYCPKGEGLNMFSVGHVIWIAISLALIVLGYAAIRVLKPSLNRVLKVCLGIGAVSEAVKVLSVTRILPMVEPQIQSGVGLTYIASGQYTPYMEMAHLPIELCSLMLVFIAAALLMKNGRWRERLLTLMYITGTIGGILGIFLAYITVDYVTVADYFLSPRVWQYFIYHAMVVTLGLYLGFGRRADISLGKLKETMIGLIALDLPTFYLNSVFSQPVYVDGKPVGIVYRVNYFSSYMNPLGFVLAEKWQWLLYLAIRLCIALVLVSLLLWLPSLLNDRPQ